MEIVDNVDGHIAIVLKPDLPYGLGANCAATLMSAVTSSHPEILGVPIEDSSGNQYPAITKVPVAVLCGRDMGLADLRAQAQQEGMFVAVFFGEALRLRSYAEYAQIVSAKQAGELDHFGILIYGDRKAVRRLTGSLPLAK